MTLSLIPSAEVEVPCTCGELVQGFLDGEPFLVSCPIDRYSRVEVALEAGVFPPAMPKATVAATATLKSLGQGDRPFSIRVSNSLPPSRGFGTSTADVVGTVAASATAIGTHLGPPEVARLAASIEPSDGTMYPGLVAFDHRSGGRAVVLGPAPPLVVAVLEFEGVVDTLEFNAHLDLEYMRSRETQYAEALHLLRTGLRTGRLEMVGRAATYSARLNQAILPKPELEKVIGFAEVYGALGVCVAHSGTVLGVLFRPKDSARATEFVSTAPRRLGGLERAWLSRLVDGGARIVGAPQRGEWPDIREDRWLSSR